MGYLRLTLRLLALFGLTLVLYLSLLIGLPLGRLFGGSPTRLKARVGRIWARGFSRIIGMRVKVEGIPPAVPFLMVTNHLGYVDVLVLMSQADCVFVAKAEIARWPLVGMVCRAGDTIFIEREKIRDIPRTLAGIERALGRGRGVVIFAEGRTAGGDQVLPFRPSLLEPAARGGLPVACATLTYSTPPGSPSARDVVCWWRNEPFWDHARELLKLPCFEARVVFGEAPIVETDRKVLAERSWQAVRSKFDPVPP